MKYPVAGIGHNSVQTPHDGRIRTRYDRDVGEAERLRYIKEGRLIPFYDCPPQLMVKGKTGWKPEIRIC